MDLVTEVMHMCDTNETSSAPSSSDSEEVEIEALAALGARLDQLVPDSQPKSRKIRTRNRSHWGVDPSLGISPVDVESILDRYESIPDGHNVENSYLSSAAKRFSIARNLAKWIINERKQQCEVNFRSDKSKNFDTVCDALSTFEEANKIDSSAVDILAAAILIPKDQFRNALISPNVTHRNLADAFDVPIGAIALRKRIIDIADSIS